MKQTDAQIFLNSIVLRGPRVVCSALLCAVCLWCAAVETPAFVIQQRQQRPRSPAPRKQPRHDAPTPETTAPTTRPH
ncbi:MAG: hypothetical protein M3R15_02025, partial [Acidobacteriota bacterium]|nr:hypothetical protein [Acidobacteriota bacterium]